MSIRQQLTDQLKEAMRAKDQLKMDALRFLQAAIKNREIELRPEPISEEEILNVIKKLTKQRRESIEQYEKGGRQDLADKEKAELQILESFLPKPMDPSEVEKLIDQVITELQAKTLKDMGSVIKTVISRTQGACDNRFVSEKVKQKLGGPVNN